MLRQLFRLSRYNYIFKNNMSTANNTKFSINHVAKSNLFEITIDGCDDKGYISYECIDDQTWDLQHTFVPESMRGQGIAKILAKFAFDHIVESDLKMKLTCWYLEKYLRENPLPQYMDKVV